jgi:signal transduction histidine kinase
MKLYVLELKKTLGHTSAFMENLLNWSLSQMQGFKLQIQLIDVSIKVNHVIEILTEQAMQKEISIQNSVPAGTLIMADINMLQLVIRNLLSNAIKFTSDNGTVVISTKNSEAGVTISVCDNGIGMSEKKVNEFNAENYIRFSDSAPGTNKEKGTGLGLMLCKNFTALMNGTLQVQSTMGQGSIFFLNLPNKT